MATHGALTEPQIGRGGSSTTSSPPSTLEWALRTVESRWWPLLAQVRDERELGWQPDRPPRPGEAEAARGFVASALTRAGGWAPRRCASRPG